MWTRRGKGGSGRGRALNAPQSSRGHGWSEQYCFSPPCSIHSIRIGDRVGGEPVSWRGTSSRFRSGVRPPAGPRHCRTRKFSCHCSLAPAPADSAIRDAAVAALAQTNSTAQRMRDSIWGRGKEEREANQRLLAFLSRPPFPIDDWGWIISPTNKRRKKQVRPPSRSRTLKSENSFGPRSQ